MFVAGQPSSPRAPSSRRLTRLFAVIGASVALACTLAQPESTEEPSSKEAPSCDGVYDNLIEFAVRDLLEEDDSLSEQKARATAERQYNKSVVLEECSFSSPAELACMVAANTQEEFEACDGASDEAENEDESEDENEGAP